MDLNRILSISYYAGMALLFAGIVLQLNHHEFALHLFVAGLIPIIGIRIYNRMIGHPDNRRKNSILVFSALALLAAAVAIYLNKSYWIVLIAVSAVLDLYISFRRF